MSQFTVFRPHSDVAEVAGGDDHDDAPASVSFALEAKKLRTSTHYAVARRARINRSNSCCPDCGYSQVLPLWPTEFSLVSYDPNAEETLCFQCEHCGTDWVA